MVSVGFSTLVAGITTGDPAATEAAYSKLMDIEQNTGVERVATMPAMTRFVAQTHGRLPSRGWHRRIWVPYTLPSWRGEYEAAKSRLMSADGYFTQAACCCCYRLLPRGRGVVTP
jgi:hypothetical protein